MEIFWRNPFHFTCMILVIIINLHSHFTSAAVGVNYGLLGDNLPPPSNVVNLYKQENIPLLRLFEAKPEVLNALRGSGLKVSLGVKNADVTSIATDVHSAAAWVNSLVVPFAKDVNIGWITVGNELVSEDPAAVLITQAMGNILNALNAAQLTGIQVSTAISGRVLGVTYPPSAGDFNDESKEIMIAIIKWLQSSNNPLFINVYPYFAFASNPTDIPLDYALFIAQKPVIDGQYTYTSLFDAMVDSFYAALDKNGGENLAVVVSETGWPNAGNEPYTTIQIAQTYNQKLIDKVKATGTPRRPSALIDCFIFAMFNENQKAEGVEQNWGLHYPNANPVYPLTF